MAGKFALIAAAAFSISGLAAAEQPVTWAFEGFVSDRGLPGGQCFEIGCQDLLASHTTFSGRLTYDLDALDLAPDDPNRGLYRSYGPSFGLQLAIGGYSYTTSYTQLSVSYNSSSFDQYTYLMQEQGDWFSRIGLISFFDRATSPLTSDAQLAQPPIGTFNGGFDPNYITTLGGADLALKVTKVYAVASPVPEPETYAMFVGGILMVLMAKRARRRQPKPA